MQRNENTPSDKTVAVTPPIRHTVPWRVNSVRALSGHRLEVTFVDGTEGQVEMKNFLNDTGLDGSPFEPLRDMEQFQKVKVVLGAVQWSTGADLAPDAMYDAIQKHGCWVVGG